ncbi:MAG: hypothetical protein ACR2JG_10260 [Geodermatophilaceae bacterium]
MSSAQPGISAAEQLRRDLANKGRPEKFLKVLRCDKGHPLVWLIRTERGIVPVASRVGKDKFGMRSIDGELMTLDEWPAGELLPTASCPCHQKVRISLHEARSWFDAARDKFVFNP